MFTFSPEAGRQRNRNDIDLRVPDKLHYMELGYGAAICLVLVFISLVVAALFYKLLTLQDTRNVRLEAET